MFRVAVSGRREPRAEPSFFTVIVWRDQAEHAAESLSKGGRFAAVLGRRPPGTRVARIPKARHSHGPAVHSRA
jgi:hypothetical protein